MTDTKTPLLDINDLHVHFETNSDKDVYAVRGIHMHIEKGETVAVVGESGSGKSQVMMSAMGLLADNGWVEGSVKYNGTEILGLSKRKLNKYRGSKMTMIFQEPMTSLDPLYTIGRQICEPLRVHQKMDKKRAMARALELLELVGDSRATKSGSNPTRMKCPAWPASACDDCHGACQQSGPADCR